MTEQWSEPEGDLTVGIPRTRTIVVEAVGLLETQLPDVLLESQPGVRQYADRPELAREVTAEGLRSRRSVSYAVIAQTPGEVMLAGVRLPWWNVTEQRWEVAELPAASGARGPRQLTPRLPCPRPQSRPRPRPIAAAARDGSYWPWVSGVLGAAWLATLALWWRSATARARGLRPPARRRRPTSKPALRKILRDLASACAVSDPAAARTALLAYAEARFAPSPPRSLGALAALLPAPLAHEVLALEAHIYGAAAGAWRGDGLEALLGDLESAAAAPEPAAGRPFAAALSIATNRVCDRIGDFGSPFGACFRIWQRCRLRNGRTQARSRELRLALWRAAQARLSRPALRWPAREGFSRVLRRSRTCRARRLSGLIGLVLVLAVTCIDLLLGASAGGLLNTLRLGILCPLLVVLGVAISLPGAQRYYTEVVAVGVTLIGFVVTYIAHLGALAGSSYVLAGLVLVVLYGCLFLGLLFNVAVTIAGVLIAAHFVTGIVVGLPFDVLYYSTAILGGAAVIGGISTYNLEHALRTNFLETRVLNELAERDGMTGLYNRRIFDDYVERLWRQSRREGTGVAIIFVDLDFFKLYNDLYGHQAGDDCLKRIATVHRSRRETAVRFRGAIRRRGVRARSVRPARRLRAHRSRADSPRRARARDSACRLASGQARDRQRRLGARQARDEPQPNGRDSGRRRGAVPSEARRA